MTALHFLEQVKRAGVISMSVIRDCEDGELLEELQEQGILKLTAKAFVKSRRALPIPESEEEAGVVSISDLRSLDSSYLEDISSCGASHHILTWRQLRRHLCVQLGMWSSNVFHGCARELLSKS